MIPTQAYQGNRLRYRLPIHRRLPFLLVETNKRRGHAEMVDLVKYGALLVTGATALEKMVKVYRNFRAMAKNPAGVTIRNGEYRALISDIATIKDAVPTLTRIENRVEQVAATMNSRLDAHGKRLDSLESRLST